MCNKKLKKLMITIVYVFILKFPVDNTLIKSFVYPYTPENGSMTMESIVIIPV